MAGYHPWPMTVVPKLLHQVLVAARRNLGWSDLALRGRHRGCSGNFELQETDLQTLHDIALKLTLKSLKFLLHISISGLYVAYAFNTSVCT